MSQDTAQESGATAGEVVEARAPASGPTFPPPEERMAGSSLARMLQILDLITLGRPAITLEEISREVGYTASTSYRYVRELTNAGLLASIGGGRYALGARVFELDLLARRTDPVLGAATGFVPALLESIPEGVVMVCELRGSQAVSVLAEKKPDTLDLHRHRGTTMDLFRGSAAKAILAHLPHRRLARIYAESADVIADAGLGADWRSFIKTISALRRQPYILSQGELDPRNFALATPVFYDTGNIAGSLNVIVPLRHYDDSLVKSIAPALIKAAEAINGRLAQLAASHPVFPATGG